MEGIAGQIGEVVSDANAPTRETVTEASVAALVCNARTRQRNVRYSELFADACVRAGAGGLALPPGPMHSLMPSAATLFRRERPSGGGSGLVVAALRHGNLTPQQRRALSTFRLEQCVLCDWYDPRLVLASGNLLDPLFEALSDNAVHVVVGTREGMVLGYFCMEPATWEDRAGPAGTWKVADRERPAFPTERDLFGPEVFATLPALAAIPIARMRELSHLMRNQTVSPASRVATLAVVEVISAMAQLLLSESTRLVAAVGHLDLEARRLTSELDVPVLYAPHAQAARSGSTALWTRDVDLPGRFWPFAIAVDDIVAYRAHFDWLDALLDQPVNQIIRALVALRREPRRHLPIAFAHMQQAQGQREGETDRTTADASLPVVTQEWTADPGCDSRPLAPMPASELARVAGRRSGLAAR